MFSSATKKTYSRPKPAVFYVQVIGDSFLDWLAIFCLECVLNSESLVYTS